MFQIKRYILFMRKCIRYMRKRIGLWISYVILVISVCILILSVGTNIAHRTPILSFIASDIKLPYSYTLNCTVDIYDGDVLLNIPVYIFVGGYAKESYSGEEFILHFSSLESEDIPIIVKYVTQGKTHEIIDYISYGKDYERTIKLSYRIGE